jgi:hypothetical protein
MSYSSTVIATSLYLNPSMPQPEWEGPVAKGLGAGEGGGVEVEKRMGTERIKDG